MPSNPRTPDVSQNPEHDALRRLEEMLGYTTAEEATTVLREAGFRIVRDVNVGAPMDTPGHNTIMNMPKPVNVGEDNWKRIREGLDDLAEGQPSRYPFQSRVELDLARDLYNFQRWADIKLNELSKLEKAPGTSTKPLPQKGPVLHAHFKRLSLGGTPPDLQDPNEAEQQRQEERREEEVKRVHQDLCVAREALKRIFLAMGRSVEAAGYYSKAPADHFLDQLLRELETLRENDPRKWKTKQTSAEGALTCVEKQNKELRVFLDHILTLVGLTEEDADLSTNTTSKVFDKAHARIVRLRNYAADNETRHNYMVRMSQVILRYRQLLTKILKQFTLEDPTTEILEKARDLSMEASKLLNTHVHGIAYTGILRREDVGKPYTPNGGLPTYQYLVGKAPEAEEASPAPHPRTKDEPCDGA